MFWDIKFLFYTDIKVKRRKKNIKNKNCLKLFISAVDIIF